MLFNGLRNKDKSKFKAICGTTVRLNYSENNSEEIKRCQPFHNRLLILIDKIHKIYKTSFIKTKKFQERLSFRA